MGSAFDPRSLVLVRLLNLAVVYRLRGRFLLTRDAFAA